MRLLILVGSRFAAFKFYGCDSPAVTVYLLGYTRLHAAFGCRFALRLPFSWLRGYCRGSPVPFVYRGYTFLPAVRCGSPHCGCHTLRLRSYLTFTTFSYVLPAVPFGSALVVTFAVGSTFHFTLRSRLILHRSGYYLTLHCVCRTFVTHSTRYVGFCVCCSRLRYVPTVCLPHGLPCYRFTLAIHHVAFDSRYFDSLFYRHHAVYSVCYLTLPFWLRFVWIYVCCHRTFGLLPRFAICPFVTRGSAVTFTVCSYLCGLCYGYYAFFAYHRSLHTVPVHHWLLRSRFCTLPLHCVRFRLPFWFCLVAVRPYRFVTVHAAPGYGCTFPIPVTVPLVTATPFAGCHVRSACTFTVLRLGYRSTLRATAQFCRFIAIPYVSVAVAHCGFRFTTLSLRSTHVYTFTHILPAPRSFCPDYHMQSGYGLPPGCTFCTVLALPHGLPFTAALYTAVYDLYRLVAHWLPARCHLFGWFRLPALRFYRTVACRLLHYAFRYTTRLRTFLHTRYTVTHCTCRLRFAYRLRATVTFATTRLLRTVHAHVHRTVAGYATLPGYRCRATCRFWFVLPRSALRLVTFGLHYRVAVTVLHAVRGYAPATTVYGYTHVPRLCHYAAVRYIPHAVATFTTTVATGCVYCAHTFVTILHLHAPFVAVRSHHCGCLPFTYMRCGYVRLRTVYHWLPRITVITTFTVTFGLRLLPACRTVPAFCGCYVTCILPVVGCAHTGCYTLHYRFVAVLVWLLRHTVRLRTTCRVLQFYRGYVLRSVTTHATLHSSTLVTPWFFCHRFCCRYRIYLAYTPRTGLPHAAASLPLHTVRSSRFTFFGSGLVRSSGYFADCIRGCWIVPDYTAHHRCTVGFLQFLPRIVTAFTLHHYYRGWLPFAHAVAHTGCILVTFTLRFGLQFCTRLFTSAARLHTARVYRTARAHLLIHLGSSTTLPHRSSAAVGYGSRTYTYHLPLRICRYAHRTVYGSAPTYARLRTVCYTVVRAHARCRALRCRTRGCHFGLRCGYTFYAFCTVLDYYWLVLPFAGSLRYPTHAVLPVVAVTCTTFTVVGYAFHVLPDTDSVYLYNPIYTRRFTFTHIPLYYLLPPRGSAHIPLRHRTRSMRLGSTRSWFPAFTVVRVPTYAVTTALPRLHWVALYMLRFVWLLRCRYGSVWLRVWFVTGSAVAGCGCRFYVTLYPLRVYVYCAPVTYVPTRSCLAHTRVCLLPFGSTGSTIHTCPFDLRLLLHTILLIWLPLPVLTRILQVTACISARYPFVTTHLLLRFRSLFIWLPTRSGCVAVLVGYYGYVTPRFTFATLPRIYRSPYSAVHGYVTTHVLRSYTVLPRSVMRLPARLRRVARFTYRAYSYSSSRSYTTLRLRYPTCGWLYVLRCLGYVHLPVCTPHTPPTTHTVASP